MRSDATVGLKHDETRVLLDPYATSVVSRQRWGERGNQDLDYENPDVLGLADTWPQAGTPLPDPNEHMFDWQVRPLLSQLLCVWRSRPPKLLGMCILASFGVCWTCQE